MGIAGENNVLNARTTFETLVDGANQMEKSQGHWQSLAREYKGGRGIKINVPMTGATPAWEEWQGSKNRRGFRKLSKDIPFKKYHKSMDLERSSVVHDQSGTTALALQTHTNDVAYVRDKLIYEAIVANGTCADGSALLANSHTFSGYNNLTTDALSFASFDAGVAAMRSQTDEVGEYLSVEPKILIVHPDEQRLALEIVESDAIPISVGTGGPVTINGGGVGAVSITNVFRGIVDVIVTPRKATGTWMLLDPRFPPFGLGMWREPEAVIADDMTGKDRMDKDLFLYDVEADINVVPLQWEGVYGKAT